MIENRSIKHLNLFTDTIPEAVCLCWVRPGIEK